MVLVGVGLAATLALRAFQDNLLYFYSPTQVLGGEAPAESRFRIGGLVEAGTLDRETGDLELRFRVTDLENVITVAYSGVLPDLFREGQGVIAFGRLGNDGLFVADELLAKHDENYMPSEVQEMLEARGHPGSGSE
jgi:cytochrome c-type biogenesis protein CcmE